jgi:hypothetical protein
MPPNAKGPFPLPFKGKGDRDDWRPRSLRRRLEYTCTMRDEVEQDMFALIEQFKQTFRPPRPASLTMHKTGNGQYVRWRLRASRLVKQQYFELSGEVGMNLLQSLSPSVREAYLVFERERVKLNLLYGLHHYEVRSLQRYLDTVHNLEGLKHAL